MRSGGPPTRGRFAPKADKSLHRSEMSMYPEGISIVRSQSGSGPEAASRRRASSAKSSQLFSFCTALEDTELAKVSQELTERFYILLAVGEGGRCRSRVLAV